jgi:hypothetical protein
LSSEELIDGVIATFSDADMVYKRRYERGNQFFIRFLSFILIPKTKFFGRYDHIRCLELLQLWVTAYWIDLRKHASLLLAKLRTLHKTAAAGEDTEGMLPLLTELQLVIIEKQDSESSESRHQVPHTSGNYF